MTGSQPDGHEPGVAVSERRVTLARLVEALGPDVVSVVAAPAGLDVATTQVCIQDPSESVLAEPGDVVLAVGTSPDDSSLPSVLEATAAADAAAVVIKSGHDEQRLAAAAERAGIAVLLVTPGMAWSQLHTLVRTVLASAGHAPQDGAAPPLGDLFALANAIAMMVGGPTTIEDTQSRVLAYSNLGEPIDSGRRATILGRKVPDEWVDRLHRAGVFKQLWGTSQVVHVDTARLAPDSDMTDRLAVAVRAGDEILGSIWVAEGTTPLGPQAAQALEQAADIAALHLVRHRAGEDIERRMRGDLFRSLLDGRGALSTVADRLGLQVYTPSVVVAFQLQTTDEPTIGLQRERVFELVSVHCEAFRRRSVQVAIGRTLYVLLPLADDASLGGARRLVAEILDRSAAVLAVPLVVGIGSVAGDLRDVPRSRHEADQVTRILSAANDARNGPDVRMAAQIDDVRAQAVLLDLQDHARSHPEILVGRIGALHREDDERGSVYVATLRAYLDSFGDIPAAAATMDVHPNTFRYRLKRACETCGLDLDDPDERLVAALQLRLV